MAQTETPGSVRIRTGEGNEWRYDAIQRAADYYERNRSDAVAFACEDVPALVKAIERVLGRDDLTTAQKREIAATCSTSAVRFDVDESVSVDRDP